MTNLTRYTKSEELIGLQFDGSPESAKEIVEWVKEVVGEQYQRGIMQRGVAKSNLGYDGNEWFRPEAMLHISINDLPDTYAIRVPSGGLVVYDPNELEVRFRTTSPDGLFRWEKEDIDGNIPEG